MRKVSLILLTLVGACSQPETLPSSRLVSYSIPTSGDGMHQAVGGAVATDHGVFIDPRCKEHEADLWAMQIEEETVSRTDPRLEMVNGRADGRYFPPAKISVSVVAPRKIIVSEGLYGWYRKDVELHERCHAWLDITTGTYVFHR